MALPRIGSLRHSSSRGDDEASRVEESINAPSEEAVRLWESRELGWFHTRSKGVSKAHRQARGTIRLRYHVLRHRPGLGGSEAPAILIITGFNETILKYVQFASELYAMGYTVFLYDHRGQGLSERDEILPPGRRQVAHMRAFEPLVQDLIDFTEQIIVPVHSQTCLFAHSMGGVVAARCLLSHSYLFSGVVLSAPAFSIVWGDKPPGMPAFAANLIGHIATWLRCDSFLPPFPGGKLEWWDPHKAIPPSVHLTHDLAKQRWYEALRSRNPGVAMLGPSMGWLRSVTEAQHDLLWGRARALPKPGSGGCRPWCAWGRAFSRRYHRCFDKVGQAQAMEDDASAGSLASLSSPECLRRVQCPVLLFTAQEDTLVKEDGHVRFCQLCPSASRVFVQGSYHELVFETDSIRDPVVQAVKQWFRACMETGRRQDAEKSIEGAVAEGAGVLSWRECSSSHHGQVRSGKPLSSSPASHDKKQSSEFPIPVLQLGGALAVASLVLVGYGMTSRR